MRKLKAYQLMNETEDGICYVTWTETAGQAKATFADGGGEIPFFDVPFKDIRVRRLKWADDFSRSRVIPWYVWFDHNFGVTCYHCGEFVYADQPHIVKDGKVYHKECYKEYLGNTGGENNAR